MLIYYIISHFNCYYVKCFVFMEKTSTTELESYIFPTQIIMKNNIFKKKNKRPLLYKLQL